MHVCSADTVKRVWALHGVYHGWRKVAIALGYPKCFAATLSKISKRVPGALSLDGENKLRRRMGFDPVGKAQVERCPSCGGAHPVADCGGVEGEPIWKSKPTGTRRNKWYRPCLPPSLKDRVEASGYTVETLIDAGLRQLKENNSG